MRVLDRTTKDRLLTEAKRLTDGLSPATLKQAAVALSILRQQGPETLKAALAPDVAYHIEASARDWRQFVDRVGPMVLRLLNEDRVAAEYFLGWVKRLGTIRSAQTRAPRR